VIRVLQCTQVENKARWNCSPGLVFESESDKFIDETYPVLSGKKRVYTNRCNEKTLHYLRRMHCMPASGRTAAARTILGILLYVIFP